MAAAAAASGVSGRERVDGPGCVQGHAARPLGGDVRVGQQVLHGLERADGVAVLVAVLGVVGGQGDGAAHRADEIGGGEGEAEGGDGGDVVAGEPIGTGRAGSRPRRCRATRCAG